LFFLFLRVPQAGQIVNIWQAATLAKARGFAVGIADSPAPFFGHKHPTILGHAPLTDWFNDVKLTV
jgi:uncharacterized protein (DUF2062 family)